MLLFGSTGNNIHRRKTNINHSLCNEILSFHATAARSFLYEGDEIKYEINTVLLIGLSTGTLCTRSNYVFNTSKYAVARIFDTSCVEDSRGTYL